MNLLGSPRRSTIKLRGLEPFEAGDGWSWLRGMPFVALLMVFCFLYGASFALFAPAVVTPFVGLLAIPAVLVIWTLPSSTRAPEKALEWLLYALLATMVLWPGYLAITLPGLPWITVSRVAQILFIAVLLVCVSVSTQFRSRVWRSVGSVPGIRNLVLAFIVLQTASLAFSNDFTNSFDKYFVAQITWTGVFFTAALVFTKPGRADYFAGLLVVMACILGVIGLLEYHMQRVPWAGHIPSFLQINDPSVARAIEGGNRSGSHRVQATFVTSLDFGEFLVIAFPFALHFVLNRYRNWVRIAAGLSVPFLAGTILLTQTRISFVGLLLTLVLLPLTWCLIAWRRNRGNLAAASVVIFSPVILCFCAMAALSVPALSYRMLGGGAQEASTQARYDQLHLGLPKILSHPWGYGIGQGAIELNFHTPGGLLTIDSYWLRLALEYGILGLLLYFALFAVALLYVGRGALQLQNSNKEKSLFICTGCVLLGDVIIRSAYAQEYNFPFIFLLLGMIAGLSAPLVLPRRSAVIGSHAATETGRELC